MADGQQNGGTAERTGDVAQPRSVDEARRDLDVTRERISQDLDVIEARLRGAADDIRERLDLLEPARARIRADVWTALAVAFGAGLAYAVLTAPRRDGRRGPVGRMVHSTVRRLPGAVFAGVRAGVADRLEEEWKGRRALPAAPERAESRSIPDA